MSKEGFQPISNIGPYGFANSVKFYGRLVADFQTLTVLPHLRKVLPFFKGEVLDVGCGQSPYKFLLNKDQAKYYGIDITEADRFNYHNSDVTYFNGRDIPFGDGKFDGLICTEVLEHVEDYQRLIDEMHRVLKPGGYIAFEVGEVHAGKTKLEEAVLPCGVAVGLEPELVLINDQEFTKTANCWGVNNMAKGTNTNRIVLFRRP